MRKLEALAEEQTLQKAHEAFEEPGISRPFGPGRTLTDAKRYQPSTSPKNWPPIFSSWLSYPNVR